METVSSAPTIKQRRKFDCVKTSNMNNQDTSSVNHNSDVYAMNKLSKHVHEEVQTLTDCCQESIRKCFLQEEKAYRRRHSDSISKTSVQNYPKMSNTLMYVIFASPFVIALVGFSTTYIMCIMGSHAESYVLFISDTGMDYPESSIATQVLNMVSIAVFLTTSLRYLMLHQYFRDYGHERIPKNYIDASFWTGLTVASSIQIIANFPAVNIGNITVHFMAVITFFVSVVIYMFIEVRIMSEMIDTVCDPIIYYIRLVTVMLILIVGISTLITAPISWYQFNGKNYRNWKPTDGGWICHIISVVGEWMFVMLSNLYLFSFIHEFRLVTIYMPVVKIRYLPVKEKTES